jgi:hypothetical protein
MPNLAPAMRGANVRLSLGAADRRLNRQPSVQCGPGELERLADVSDDHPLVGMDLLSV